MTCFINTKNTQKPKPINHLIIKYFRSVGLKHFPALQYVVYTRSCQAPFNMDGQLSAEGARIMISLSNKKVPLFTAGLLFFNRYKIMLRFFTAVKAKWHNYLKANVAAHIKYSWSHAIRHCWIIKIFKPAHV